MCQDLVIVEIIDLILSHGIYVNGVEVLQQSDDISDHSCLVLCKLHIAKAVNSTPSYKYGRTYSACPLTAPLLSLNLLMILWFWASFPTMMRPHTWRR